MGAFFSAIGIQILEFAVGLLVKIFSEKISTYMKDQQAKVAEIKLVMEKRAADLALAKAAAKQLNQAQTKEEIDAATDDTLNNT